MLVGRTKEQTSLPPAGGRTDQNKYARGPILTHRKSTLAHLDLPGVTKHGKITDSQGVHPNSAANPAGTCDFQHGQNPFTTPPPKKAGAPFPGIDTPNLGPSRFPGCRAYSNMSSSPPLGHSPLLARVNSAGHTLAEGGPFH